MTEHRDMSDNPSGNYAVYDLTSLVAPLLHTTDMSTLDESEPVRLLVNAALALHSRVTFSPLYDVSL